MKYKYFSKIFVSIVFIFFAFVILINFIIDPISMYRKNIQFPHIENKSIPEYIALKLFSDFDYSLVGTSRSQKIDKSHSLKYGVNLQNMSIAGSSIDINYTLVKEIKSKNKNVILFLDPYTLSIENRDFKDKLAKDKILLSEIENLNTNPLYFYIKYLVSAKTLKLSLSTLKDFLLNKDKDFYYTKKESSDIQVVGNAKKFVSAAKVYDKFIINHEVLNKTIKLLKKGDIIVIPPLSFEYYKALLEKGALKKYFDVIDHILNKNKSIKIQTFLKVNNDLKDFRKFDSIGSHFNFSYGYKIVDDIFSKEQNISLILTKNNFVEYRNQISKWLQMD